MTTKKQAIKPDALYRVTLDKAIEVGGRTLRPQRGVQHKIKGRLLQQVLDQVASYEAV